MIQFANWNPLAMFRAMIALLFVSASFISADAQQASLKYAPAPEDNPLKGLVPYAADVRTRFPHSMEFNYIALSAIVTSENEFDWNPLESILNPDGCR